MTTVADVVGHLEAMAPLALAEAWDNCGLQAGALNWPVERIWVALDPLPEVVAAACRNDVDLLVTHHPLIFRPLMRVDVATPTGRIIAQALAAEMAIYAAHTNYDSAVDGLNDVLARRLGVTAHRALAPAAGAATPDAGIGRIGTLERPVTLGELARMACTCLGLDEVNLVGDPQAVVREAALCSGSGGSLVEDFMASAADVYITGEIRYHQARDIAAAGRGAIDIGHFGSERIMIQDVAERLGRALAADNVTVAVCNLENDPFTRVRTLSQMVDKTV
jgi:dinuclear metal center YbgI/SA1388 family protein